MKAHFDLDAVERQVREAGKTAFAAAIERAEDDADRRLIEMQGWVSEARIVCSLAGFRAVNEGADPVDWMETIGMTLANILINAAGNSSLPSHEARRVAVGQMFELVTAHVTRQAADGCMTQNTRISAMHAGNA